MAKTIVPWDSFLKETCRALGRGGALLIGQGLDGKPNPMTIGWGAIGVVWARPVFVVLVRPSRHTYSRLEENGDFTVCVLPPRRKDVLDHCGTVSGRDEDKIAALDLKPLRAAFVCAPILEEAVIAYECRTVQKNDLAPRTIAPDILASAYPVGNFHRCYYGHILAVQAEDNAAEVLS